MAARAALLLLATSLVACGSGASPSSPMGDGGAAEVGGDAARGGLSGPLFIPMGAVWKYFDTGMQPVGDWKGLGFDDSTWAQGPAKLGYEDGAVTTIATGPDAMTKHIAYYFRHTFEVSDPDRHPKLQIKLIRDDGAIIYVNGMEVVRDNMPIGPVDAETLAVTFMNAPEETTVYTFPLETTPLIAGKNVVAVEVHQQGATSSDLGFDLELSAP